MRISACSRRGAALGAIAANFQAGDDDMKPAIALDLSLEAVEEVAFEFRILPQRKQAMWMWSR